MNLKWFDFRKWKYSLYISGQGDGHTVQGSRLIEALYLQNWEGLEISPDERYKTHSKVLG